MAEQLLKNLDVDVFYVSTHRVPPKGGRDEADILPFGSWSTIPSVPVGWSPCVSSR